MAQDVISQNSQTASASALEIRGSLTVINPDECRARVGSETLVVTGPPRSRTSLVAYVLRRAGYFLGDIITESSHEDFEIGEAMKDHDANKLLSIVERRNGAHQRWGFKQPFASNNLSWLTSAIRNPVVVVTFRNPLAIARTMVRRVKTYQETAEDFRRALDSAMRRTRLAAEQVVLTDVPIILVDTDLAIANPRAFIEDFLGLLSLARDEQLIDTLAADISSPGYKRVDGTGPAQLERGDLPAEVAAALTQFHQDRAARPAKRRARREERLANMTAEERDKWRERHEARRASKREGRQPAGKPSAPIAKDG